MKKLIEFLKKIFGVKTTPKKISVKYSPIEGDPIFGVELEFFNLVNEYRISNGLKPLTLEMLTTKLADEHVQYMVNLNKVSHDNFDRRSKRTRAFNIGEICAYGYKTPLVMFNAYKRSKTHNSVMLANSLLELYNEIASFNFRFKSFNIFFVITIFFKLFHSV